MEDFVARVTGFWVAKIVERMLYMTLQIIRAGE
jgi:hypothetical protein